MKLQPGDKISFYARVKSYYKGYKGNREFDEYDDIKPIEKDYKLSHPNKFQKIILGKLNKNIPTNDGSINEMVAKKVVEDWNRDFIQTQLFNMGIE